MQRIVSFWFVLGLGLALAACDDSPEDADAGPSGGMDSGPGGTDAGTDAGPGDAGFDAGPDAMDAGAPDAAADAAIPPGACSNADDEAALGMIDVAMEATTCGNTCFGGAMCVTRCMEMHGLSSECATCFGATANCAARNCALDCAGGDTPACTECRRMEGCISDFEACSGLPGS